MIDFVENSEREIEDVDDKEDNEDKAENEKDKTDSEKEKEARKIATVDDKNDELSEFGEVEDNSWTKVIPRLSFASREAICRVKTASTVTKENQNVLLSLGDIPEKNPEDEDTLPNVVIKKTVEKTEKNTIFVGGISVINKHELNQRNTTKNALLDHFSKFGQIKDIDMIAGFSDYRREFFPNFAFITFENEQSLENVFKEPHFILNSNHNSADEHANCDVTRHPVTIRRYEANHHGSNGGRGGGGGSYRGYRGHSVYSGGRGSHKWW